MNVRRFLLENEKGQQFRLDNLSEGCFLTSPTNLGYSYSIDFVQLGSDFIENSRKIQQKNPSGTLYFRSYDKVKEFCDFVECSKKLKWIYIIPFEAGERTYYRDVSLVKLDKTEKSGKWLACPVEFAGLSLWYEQNETIFNIETFENEMRYPFTINSRYIKYNTRSIQVQNRGHIEAPIQVVIDGFVKNPSISIWVDKEEFASIKIPIVIEEYEKFLYSSKTGEIYIQKQKADGTLESLWKKDYIDINKQNIIKLPVGTSEIRLTADDDVVNAKLTIFPQYKVV